MRSSERKGERRARLARCRPARSSPQGPRARDSDIVSRAIPHPASSRLFAQLSLVSASRRDFMGMSELIWDAGWLCVSAHTTDSNHLNSDLTHARSGSSHWGLSDRPYCFADRLPSSTRRPMTKAPPKASPWPSVRRSVTSLTTQPPNPRRLNPVPITRSTSFMEPIVLGPEPKEPIVLGPSVPDFDLTPGDISGSHSVAPEGSRGCWHRLVHTIRAGAGTAAQAGARRGVDVP